MFLRNISKALIGIYIMDTWFAVIHNVLKKETELPTDDDVQTAALAIINVWNVYALYLDDVINGTFPDAEDKSLSADDIFYIADAAKQAGKLYEAVTWFKYLAGKLDQFSTRDFQDATLYQRLAASYHEVSNFSVQFYFYILLK